MKVKIVLLIIVLIGYSQPAKGQLSVDSAKKVVLIDPGHGGIDSGAIAENGLHEKDVVLDIAKNMIFWNKGLLESKYDIYLTRSKDTLISLNDRTRLANHLKPDVFISLHCNQIGDSSIQGIETYTYTTDGSSLRFASTISERLNEELGFRTRETGQANFQILRETVEVYQSILLEIGYLSNPEESDYLNSTERRKVLALAILMAI